jgi:hypothetical protein
VPHLHELLAATSKRRNDALVLGERREQPHGVAVHDSLGRLRQAANLIHAKDVTLLDLWGGGCSVCRTACSSMRTSWRSHRLLRGGRRKKRQ